MCDLGCVRCTGRPVGVTGVFMQTIGFRAHQRLLLTLFLAAAGCLSGCGRSDISERPPLDSSSDPNAIATQMSTIGAVVAVPLSEASRAANAALPPTYSQDWVDGEDACVDLGRVLGKHCVGTKYKYTVSRGDIAIAPSGAHAIKLSVDVAVSGQGGLRGPVPQLLKADAKNFDAAATIEIVMTPHMGADWCPTIDVVPSYTWTGSPRVEIVSRVNIDVSDQVKSAIDGKMPQLVRAVQSSINCSQLRARLASMYGTQTFPLQVSAQTLHVNLEPLDFAFTGFDVDAQALRLGAVLTAKLEVSGASIAPAKIPLPPSKTIRPGAPPRLSVSMPIRASFAMLQNEAQRFVGRTFDSDTTAGKISVTVLKAEVYPTPGRKIAVGLELDAKLPGKLLDTKGRVFIVGAPIAEGRTVIRLDQPTFTRALNNDLWGVFSALLDTRIRTELVGGLRYDFAEDMEKVKRALAGRLADPAVIPNARVSVADVDIGVGRVGVSGTDLVAEAIFGANVTVHPNLVGLVAGR